MLEQNQSLLGNHPKFQKALEFARNVSVTKSPALIVGEIGTGKKALCQYIHQNSSRANGPLIAIDCALEAQQVENLVLGYRDAETGRFHKGALESANGGTVIFVNVDGIEENFQKRIYQILQELQDYDLDVRALATTTKNLSKFVGAGRFHRALYTYFSSTQITLNPLREREGDVEIIAKSFARVYCEQKSIAEKSFSEEALNKMKNYYWTHNILELRSVVEGAIQEADGAILGVEQIKLGERKSETTMNEDSEDGIRLMSLKEAEKLLIKKALIHTSENRTQAAKILGVSIRTLRNKINEYRGDNQSYFVNLR